MKTYYKRSFWYISRLPPNRKSAYSCFDFFVWLKRSFAGNNEDLLGTDGFLHVNKQSLRFCSILTCISSSYNKFIICLSKFVCVLANLRSVACSTNPVSKFTIFVILSSNSNKICFNIIYQDGVQISTSDGCSVN